MADIINRESLDEILFDALRTVYIFERTKVALFNLTYTEIYLLQFLRRTKGVMMNEIAEEMHIPVSTATRMIGRLEKRGLLTRKKDQGDFRKKKVFLKEAGLKIVSEVENHNNQVIRKNFKKYTRQEIESFIYTAVELKNLLIDSG